MNIGVVVNPTSGRGRGSNAGARAVAALGASGFLVEDLTRASYEDALSAARSAVGAGHVDALVVVGGDGMVHLGVNAVAGTAVPLGVIAAGTGNDFARAIGGGRRGDKRVSAMLEALRRPSVSVDTGLLTVGGQQIRFAGVVSAGIDAAVNQRANQVSWPRGQAKYALSALREITTFQPYGYRIRWWGEHVEQIAGVPTMVEPDGSYSWVGAATVIAVANNGWIGGGMHVAPQASITDGVLDVVIGGEFTRWGATAVLPRLFTGTHVAHPMVSVVRATRVRIEASGEFCAPPPTYADGQWVGELPVEISVTPGSLHLMGLGG